MSSTTDHWRAFGLRGLAAIVFGVLAFVWPGVTLALLVLLWGAYALVDGVLALVGALRTTHDHRWGLLLEGVVGVVAGALTFVWPGAGALALVWLIGAYAIVFGALLIALAVQLHGLGHGHPAHATA